MRQTEQEKIAARKRAMAQVRRLPNIRLFILFRVLFNARFYYPVFTILFLDFGLSLQQFALLNTVWAVTIVLAEVPSGALADMLGRKALMVSTAVFMVAEIALIAFVPLGHPQLVLSVFIVNRVLSGLAEAMASGADEALTYDTLVAHGLADMWPRVLEIQMRTQNAVYIGAMTVGAAVYDPDLVNRVLHWCGSSLVLDQHVTMRFPLYLTLMFALLALAATLRMRDIAADGTGKTRVKKQGAWQMLLLTLKAGRWILHTPLALAVILFAMTFDHILRLVATLTSEYYRLINLPESLFGVLGSLAAVVGLFVPQLARWMTEHCSPAQNAAYLAVTMVAALFGMALFMPNVVGIIPIIVIFGGMTMMSLFTSHYLNEMTTSDQRATVLSFKGMALNTAYGIIGVVFAGMVQHFRAGELAGHPGWTALQLENQAFKMTVHCFPWYLMAALAVVTLICLPGLLWSSRQTQGKHSA